jgi:hypothetical protein
VRRWVPEGLNDSSLARIARMVKRESAVPAGRVRAYLVFSVRSLQNLRSWNTSTVPIGTHIPLPSFLAILARLLSLSPSGTKRFQGTLAWRLRVETWLGPLVRSQQIFEDEDHWIEPALLRFFTALSCLIHLVKPILKLLFVRAAVAVQIIERLFK